MLPPNPGGTIAAPDADVMVFTHAGYDELSDIVSIWDALPLGGHLRRLWWRKPGASLPRDDDGRAEWLMEVRTPINAWIDEQTELSAWPEPPPSRRPPPKANRPSEPAVNRCSGCLRTPR